MQRSRRKIQRANLILFSGLVFAVVVFDRFTKVLALSFLSFHQSVPVIEGFFHLTLIKNTGVAFGLLGSYGVFLHVVIPMSILVLLVIAYRLCTVPAVAEDSGGRRTARGTFTKLHAGLALILGGAIGNWLDRLWFGAVVDFLDFRIWPVFNFADTAITIGVSLYLIVLLRGKQ